MTDKIFTQIDRLSDTYVDIWEDVCNIESPSKGKAAIDRVGVGGERAHSVEEYGVIASLSESAKRIASIIYRL